MKVRIAYGDGELSINVPADARVLCVNKVRPLADPEKAVAEALLRPIESPPLEAVVASNPRARTACIIVSDATRPVPNKVLLPPLLAALERAGVTAPGITLLIATGMHRPSTPEEKIRLFGREILGRYRVADHDSSGKKNLVKLPGRTGSGTQVSINRIYHDADIKIATGLIEPHFMAGFSGGRKSICPGIVNLETIQNFHGCEFLSNPRAASGILRGNPCHKEALEAARLAGMDFVLNCIMDDRSRLVAVVAGHPEKAFLEGVRKLEAMARVYVNKPADIVVTSGGGAPLDATFYQAVKGMVTAGTVIRTGGTAIVAASCSEGIGSGEYRELMLRYSGRWREFLGDIRQCRAVMKDQWEFQMHMKLLEKVGEDNIIFCTDGIAPRTLRKLSVRPGFDIAGESDPEAQVQKGLDAAIRTVKTRPRPKIAIIPKGPYVLAGLKKERYRP